MSTIVPTADMDRFFGGGRYVGVLSGFQAVNPATRVWIAAPTGTTNIGIVLPPVALGNSALIDGGPYFLIVNSDIFTDLIVMDAFLNPIALLLKNKCFEVHLTDNGWVFSTQKSFSTGAPVKASRLPHIFGGRYWTGSLLYSKQPKEYNPFLKTWATILQSSVNTHAGGSSVELGTQNWLVGSILSPLNGFSHYDGVTQTWPSSQPPAPSWLVNGSYCYVTGHGSGSSSSIYVSGRTTTWGHFGVAIGSWTSIASTGTTLFGGMADSVSDRQLILGSSSSKWYECLEGNIVTESFSRMPIMPPTKRNGSGAHVGDSLLYAVGPGNDEFNRASLSWRTTTAYPGSSTQTPGCMALVPDKYLYAFSGAAATGGDTSWRFNNVTEAWEATTATPNPYDLIAQQTSAGRNS